MKITALALTLSLSALAASECLLKCPAGDVCIEDPKPRCAVPHGACEGFAGTPCTVAGDKCVDDPRDDCDPLKGGADCIGVCVAPAASY